MGDKRRERHRRPARRAAYLTPLPRLLVLCEGRVTEPEYLLGFATWVKNPRVRIEIPKEHGVPLTLVTKARDRKLAAANLAVREGDENLAFDAVWCVFDIDEHPNVNDARQLAAANGIELAVSNPCFELWLLLHFRESPGARHRHDVQKLLGEYLPGFDKHVDFPKLVGGYAAAVQRAVRIDSVAESIGETGGNPSTTVCRLTELIRGS